MLHVTDILLNEKFKNIPFHISEDCFMNALKRQQYLIL